ncbi:uncharacterized protein LOC130891489 [Diorhabda carinulata]|uniref:uncharacterized protein LOC130891489 n=1 Tax=Diorhabda carinulata TaxID=1163345 RepID=UPI0025A277F8|nr:uncharacterized protein LOC130891489 [Diorhabda carinulata]
MVFHLNKSYLQLKEVYPEDKIPNLEKSSIYGISCDDCDYVSSETPVYGGLEILTKIFRQYLKSQPEDLKLGDGVHIVSTRSENDARASTDDGTIFGVVEKYLENHELRIRLPELMPGEGFGRAFKAAMDQVNPKTDESSARGKGGGGGGKGGGGMGGIVVLGMMMGKMMAALGIGGVGLLAMKALMVSALALMLSIIIGLKKLVHSDHDEGHTVIHAGGHGHEYRKKREANEMAYHAWEKYKQQ